jgi:uncharacterized protein YidB (DUF937 family)
MINGVNIYFSFRVERSRKELNRQKHPSLILFLAQPVCRSSIAIWQLPLRRPNAGFEAEGHRERRNRLLPVPVVATISAQCGYPADEQEETIMGLLDNVLGGGSRGGMSPITMALIGLLAYRTFQGKGRLADMLGHKPADPARAGAGEGASGGLGGMLGGLLGGGAAGGILSSGLSDLLKQFQTNGQGERAKSWIESGPNKPVSPAELEQALGSDRVEWLMRETGMSREELLAGLSRELPQTVDKLTPQGRLPTEQEAARMF